MYHNNILENEQNVHSEGQNQWSYRNEGNYWADYNGTDTDFDGIGDTPYYECEDEYPLMHRFILGDMNVDGRADFADINSFVLALSNPTLYQTTYRILPVIHGDCNQDGALNFADINPFVAILIGR